MAFPIVTKPNTVKLNSNAIGKWHYSRYWREWSQIINVEISNYGVVHVTEKGLDGYIRTHCTALGRGDLLTNNLPE